jgi:hypothetical protein
MGTKHRVLAEDPEVAREWHPTKNGELTPETIGIKSKKKVWWRCLVDPRHEWDSSPAERTGFIRNTDKRAGCPFCSGRRVSALNSLATHFPNLAAEWHPTKNGSRTPETTWYRSTLKYWWQCPKDPTHVYSNKLYRRTERDLGCPYCHGRRRLLGNVSEQPDLMAQWHKTKNVGVSPEDLSYGSSVRVWWKCPAAPDHEWQATVLERTSVWDKKNNKRRGCPFCSGIRVARSSSLAVGFPHIAREWHPTKNGDRTPENVDNAWHGSAWWQCAEDPTHEWRAPVRSRVLRETGCPICAKLVVPQKRLKRERPKKERASFLEEYPDIAEQWHPTKNGDLTPHQVRSRSGLKVWWLCPVSPDHEWAATVSERTSIISGTINKRRGCPFCSKRRVTLSTSLAANRPDIAAEWHPVLNGDLMPDQVGARSSVRVYWLCPKGADHVWRSTVGERTRQGKGCPVCSGHTTVPDNSLAARYPELAAEWHESKNGDVTPWAVAPGAPKRYWWRCSKDPTHEWFTSPVHRTRHESGCPYCAGKRASATNNLAVCDPEIAAWWHPTKNGDLTPYDVTHHSGRDPYWKCPKGDDHEWRQPISVRVKWRSACPFCSNRKLSVTNSLATVNPRVAAEWHPTNNGDLTPEDIIFDEKQRVWWKCPAGRDHEWAATVYQRVIEKQGCPFCLLSRQRPRERD